MTVVQFSIKGWLCQREDVKRTEEGGHLIGSVVLDRGRGVI